MRALSSMPVIITSRITQSRLNCDSCRFAVQSQLSMLSQHICPCPFGKSHIQCGRLNTSNIRCKLQHHVAFKALPSTLSSGTSLRDDLLHKVQGRQWGSSDTPDDRQQVLDLVNELSSIHRESISSESRSSSSSSSSSESDSSQQPAVCPPTAGPLGGDWQLIWTTEAAVHKLVKGQVLGIPVTDIQQQIDLSNKRVNNKICFGLFGLQLLASGPLTVLNTTRIYYSFDKLMLGLLGLQLKLPLFVKGGGWTDCVYFDERADLRVMKNSRQDTLILIRSC